MDKKKKILLVEDEAVVAASEAMLLIKHGYEVITAQSGEEAIEMFTQNPDIELVIMDVDLGEGIDGTDSAKRILELKEVPVVFLSAHTEPEIVAKTEEITSYGYIVKDSGDTVLLTSIKMALRLFEAKHALNEKNIELKAANQQLQAISEELEAINEEYEEANEELLRTNEELLKKEKLLDFLNRITRSLAAYIDVRGAVESILHALLELESIDCGCVYVADLDKGSLDLIIHKGLSQEFVKLVSHYDRDSPNVQIAMQGPLYTNYAEIVENKDEVRLKEGLRALAVLPVFHAGRLVAVLNLASRTKDDIPVDIRSTLEAIAMQIGSSLHRVLLFEKLQKSEARYRGLINSMNEGFCYHELVYDEKGIPVDYRILEVNAQYEKMTGISPTKAIGALASKLYGSGEPPYLDIYADVALSGKGQCFETYYQPLNRHYRISVYSSEEGRFATIFQDITKEKKLLEALKESEERWHFALEGAGDGVWDWNAQTDKVYFSTQWKRMLGYEEDEIGDTLDEWKSRVHPDDLEMVYEQLNKHFNGEIPYYVSEHRMRCKDGSYKWILNRGKVITRTEDGKPLRVIGTHVDITDRKRKDEEIQLLIRERDMMLRELQHRIKNSLAMMASLISYEMEKTTSQETHEILNSIKIRSLTMSELYGMLYEKGIAKEVRLAEFLHRIIKMLKAVYLSSNSHILVEEYLEDFPLEVKASSALGLILNELFVNAVKHSFSNNISGVIAISILLKDNTALLKVADTGKGLPREFSVESTTGRGFDLILALVRQIKGELFFERVDVGTCVCVRFPVKR